ncbi:MAG: hybrid sensor histidine kinase/response regulator [Bacteroidetes bacterium]|nr:hybrid sensor histidine kinase/response regulator [Bacteroidota bacterium]
MKNNILIVEDSPTQLEQLRFILEQNNYQVRATTNGLKAMEAIHAEKPDLVISDILMPEMDGYTLCKTIKDTEGLAEVPIMLLTNLSDPRDVIKGLQAGADNFLTKPYNEDFLLSRIKYILINREMRKSTATSDMGLEIAFGGEKYFINSDRMQIIDLLLSTYESAIQKNLELSEANKQLVSMHREMAIKNSELEKLNEEKGKFLRMAAHDIRNPVAAILSSSEFLLEMIENRIDESEQEYLTMITKSGEYVLRLLNELLDLEVIESGNLELNYQDIDFVNLAQRSIDLNQMVADNKSIKIYLNPPDEPVITRIDSTKIDQVLNNLISNAIKYSHPEHDINVDISLEGNGVLVAIRDNGQGIPENEQHKLFKPFGKTSVRGTDGEESTGLGLSIAKKIIENHNGRVWFESEVKKGSTFYFTLPLV